MIPILLIALLSVVAQWLLPWWSIALVTFAFCFGRSTTSGRAFGHSFLGIALVWLAYAAWQHWQTGGILTGRMAALLFKTDSAATLLVVTPLIGGLVGGLAGLAGHYARHVVRGQMSQGRS